MKDGGGRGGQGGGERAGDGRKRGEGAEVTGSVPEGKGDEGRASSIA